ncbi:MAG: sulfatase-like hydrolase/transferase [Gammaproteobacteria bacterium]|nr:sulfatase-like hydrolase/transferase [Gammaproteobacteria bacterium]
MRTWGRRRFAAALAVLAASMGGTAAAAAPDSAPRPNIVVFLSDDMGWGQPGFNGGTEVGTPSLDRIANEGVKLTQFYVVPSCWPSRASLMSGRHHWKTGGKDQRSTGDTTMGMLPDERTIAEALRDAGYATWMVGKWHLGQWESEHLPLQRGFDHHYGFYSGTTGYYTHRVRNKLSWHRNGRPVVELGYTTFLMAEEAVQLIERHDGSNPFFLYVAFNAPHLPRGVPPEYKARYAHLPNADQRGQVKAMDDAIGWVLDALDRRDMFDDTLVVFFNDNGGRQRAGWNRPYRGEKGDLLEGGIRVPAVMRWPGHIPAGSETDALLHVVDLFPTLAGLAGAEAETVLPLDGLDAWQAISAGAASPREEVAHSLDVIRVGDWKLIEEDGLRWYGGNSTLKLYNIGEDPYETTNLASSEPAKVAELRGRLDYHRQFTREQAPARRIPASAVVYGKEENAAYGAAVERAIAALETGNKGPVLERLEAVDDRVRLDFDEPVDADFVPPASAFRVVAPPSYAAVEVADVEANGTEVVLTLASPRRPGTTVGITYDVPDSGAIRNVGGLEAVGITWRTARVTSADPVWQSTVTVEARDGYRGYSSIAHPDQGAVADHTFDYGEGAAYQVQIVLAYSGGVVFQVRNRSDAVSDLVLEWVGETLPLAEARWDPSWDRYTWDEAWLQANAPSLTASAHARTLRDGSTAAVCLRFAEGACPETSPADGSGTASDDATLSSLALSGIDIGTFAPGTATYTAAVGHDVSSTQVTATANHASANVTITDADGSTTGTSRMVALAEGSNAITVTVTAEDGTTTAVYTVTVTRAAAPASPILSVADARTVEGGDAVLSFAVRLSFTASTAVTVEYATRDVTATAGDDYTAASGTLALAAGETAGTVSVAVLDDAEDEDDETLTLILSDAVGASVEDGSATGTVVDDDPSADATLSSLALSGIDIGTFAPGTATYTAAVGHDVSSTQVTATANHASANVTITDADGSTTGTSRTVALAEGLNAITVTVTAEDGVTTAVYTVTVTREVAAPATPLTASFSSAPASHDGSKAFRVRLSFSAALLKGSELQIRRALWVTRGAAKTILQVESRLDLWEVEIKPAGTDAVTMSLASTGSCGDRAAICTADGRALSNEPSVTVDGPPDAALTASFQSVPAEHDGSSTFIVHLKFSDDITTSYRPLRDQALSATNGTVRRARRIDHRNDLWEVHVEPSGNDDVTVTLDPATDDCTETGSVCTSDGRALSNTPSVTVNGPSTAAAIVNGPLVTLKWGSPRDDFGSPSGTDYGVRVNGSARAVVSAELAGTTAWLTLASPVAPGDSVTVAYLGSAMHPLADATGLVRSGPWDGLAAENLTGTGRFRASAPMANSRPADPLAAAAEDTLRLDASGLGLADLWGVARLTALERVDLSDNAVSDLSPLAGLANLRDLDLSGNRVTDLWPLSGMYALERLNLSANAVADVQALAALPNLKVVLLDGNAVSDIGPLTHLTALENLGLAGNPVADLTALQDLPRLRRLDLTGNPAADMSPLGDVGSLVWLTLPGHRVGASAGTLGRLTELRWVWFGTVEAPRNDVPGLR